LMSCRPLTLGLIFAAALARGEEAQFTGLGGAVGELNPIPLTSRLKVARVAGEPIVIGTAGSNPGLLAAWQPSTGWRTLNTTYPELVDVSDDGADVLALTWDYKSAAVVDRASGVATPLPPFPAAATFHVKRWALAGFYGERQVAGIAYLSSTLYGGEYPKPFRLDLHTGVYTLVPSPLPETTALFLTGVSRESGRLVLRSGAGSGAKIYFFDVGGGVREEPFRAGPLLGGAISSNGNWLALLTDYSFTTRIRAREYTDRWDLRDTAIVKTQLSQLPQPWFSTIGGTATFNAVLNDGTLFGSVFGEVGPDNIREACVWHPNGVRNRLLAAVSAQFGLQLPGWRLFSVSAVSADGCTLTGLGANPQNQSDVWLLRLPQPLSAPQPAPELWAQASSGFSSASSLSLSYASVEANGTDSRQLVLNNIGDAPLVIQKPIITGPDAAFFAVPGLSNPVTIPVGESRQFSVTFFPNSSGFKFATLTLGTNDPAHPELVIEVSGEGPAPKLELFDNFSAVTGGTIQMTTVPGRYVEKEIRIRNTGTQDATGLVAELVGNTVPGLQIIIPPQNTLGRYSNAFVTLRFAPVTAGAITATLRVRCTHATTLPAQLSVATLANSPSIITLKDAAGAAYPSGSTFPDFGLASVDAHISRSLTVQSSGVAKASDLLFSFAGANPSDFSTSSAGLAVRFSPRSVGLKSARLVIDSPEHLVEPYILHLSGQCVAGTYPQFLTFPRSELNTATVGKAQFRILGNPSSYRILRSGGTPGPWQAVSAENDISLNLQRSDFARQLQIELSGASGTIQSPPFRRMNLTLSSNSIILAPKEKTLIQCEHFGELSSFVFQWLKDGQPIQKDKVIGGVDSKVLTFNGLRPSDEGLYSCRVTLKAPDGEVTVTVGETHLDVLPPPVVVPFTFRPARAMEYIHAEMRASGMPHTLTTFKVTGLPPGLRSDSMGWIYGQILPSAALTVPKEYVVKVQAANGAGAGPIYTTTWHIEPFDGSIAGTYHAIIGRSSPSSGNLGGGVTVTVTAGGTYTGRATVHGLQRSVSGKVIGPAPAGLPADYDPPLPSSMSSGRTDPLVALQLPMPGGYSEYVWFALLDDIVAGEQGVNQPVIGFKQKPAPAEFISGKLPGRYHFTLNPGESDVKPVYEPPPKTPKGSGFAAVLISPDGKVTWTGKLPEGTAITGSSGLGRDASTSSWLVPVHLIPHGNWSCIQGFFGFKQGNPIASALLDWSKSPPLGTRTRLYPWIPLISLEGEGSRYLTGKDLPLLNDSFNFAGTSANGALTLSLGGLTSDLSAPLRLEKTGRISVMPPPDSPLKTPRLSWTSSTGIFSTSTSVISPDPLREGKTLSRTLAGQSLWIPHLRQAIGQFTLPQLADPSATPPTTATTSPIYSGRTIIEPAASAP
jgi:hypothetical protein